MNWQQIYKDIADPLVRRMYRRYEDIFKSDAMDLEDIKQDVRVAIWKLSTTNKKFTDNQEMTKYVRRTVANILNSHIMNIIKVHVEDDIRIFSNTTTEPQRILKSLKPKLSDLQYKILAMLYVDHMSYGQIAAKLSIPKNKVAYTYYQTVKNHAVKKYTALAHISLETLLGDVDLQETSEDDEQTDIMDTSVVPQTPALPEDVECRLFIGQFKNILTDNQYQIIEKYYVDGFSMSDIANQLGYFCIR
jgi:DNA-directed RNA polymerase specialized sigma24 family protein